MNNFYTSPNLFLQVQNKCIDARGTARINRKYMPVQLKTEKLKLKRDEEGNQKMAGVDRLDQMLGSYVYSHKSSKWYHTVYTIYMK